MTLFMFWHSQRWLSKCYWHLGWKVVWMTNKSWKFKTEASPLETFIYFSKGNRSRGHHRFSRDDLHCLLICIIFICLDCFSECGGKGKESDFRIYVGWWKLLFIGENKSRQPKANWCGELRQRVKNTSFFL